jgi:UDP-N-acetyl-2-amino-2-deoxyglucuronate dehydrogenase
MTDSQTTPLRYVLIGCGGIIAPTHIAALAQHPGAQLIAMSDIDATRGAERAASTGCAFYTDHRAMLDEISPNVAVITAPHPFHTPLARDCFAAGAHVLVEKPMAVEVAEADAMIAAAEQADRILAVNFQFRFRPAIAKARELIATGVLGELVRVLCVEPWYRTAAYYRSAGWRGTWAGEGGGVLMNQAPHTLDMICYLVGMPAKIWGWTRTRAHAIEVEDSAQAMLEYPNGAPGYLHVSTVEAGSRRRIQIIGDHGALELADSGLTLTRFAQPLSEFREGSAELFAAPGTTTETIEVPEGDGGGHLAVYSDLHAAIVEGHAPLIDGREGRMSLELANAITLSSYTERPVTLPLDREAYSELLTSLRTKAGRQGDKETRRE